MADGGTGRSVVCRVGSKRFALPVGAVREVVAAPPTARIPGAPEAVCGVANVHGTLVTVVSGPRLLDLDASVPCEWLVVLALQRGRVGVEVDDVEDVAGAELPPKLDVEALIGPLLSVAT